MNTLCIICICFAIFETETRIIRAFNSNTTTWPEVETNSYTRTQDETEGVLLTLVLPDFVTVKAVADVGLKRNSTKDQDLSTGTPLGDEDFGGIEHLVFSDYKPPEGDDPIAKSGYFEGDIVEDLIGRNAIRDRRTMWPDGVVPYTISPDFTTRDRRVIAAAFREYEENTCIRFVSRTNEYDYIHISPGYGCSSLVGRNKGVQIVSLGDGCVYVGVVIHELMHAVGFWHEQSRADRDDYVKVLWNNIQEGMEYNFAKYTLKKIQHLDEPYDYESVMHYNEFAFARSQYQPTIRPIKSEATIGQRRGFSQTDIRKINKLYSCEIRTTAPNKTTTTPVTECSDNDKNCGIWAEQGECKKNPEWMLVNCKVSCQTCGRCINVN
ncbi:hatching enzyme 1.2-like [Tachypleus tridentatus]|uniref:hatching enzyme 1.2-like n=1 Tax=Tachypleus tridentatus TaxID=6853 RepID=UPI003FD45776